MNLIMTRIFIFQLGFLLVLNLGTAMAQQRIDVVNQEMDAAIKRHQQVLEGNYQQSSLSLSMDDAINRHQQLGSGGSLVEWSEPAPDTQAHQEEPKVNKVLVQSPSIKPVQKTTNPKFKRKIITQDIQQAREVPMKKKTTMSESFFDNGHGEVSFQIGKRSDDLQWSIADTDGNPNILSELTWSDIESIEMKHRGEYTPEDQPYHVDWSAGFGFITDGSNQDSDYLGNNRTLEFSRSNNDSSDGTVVDLSFGAGRQFKVVSSPKASLILTPMAGYSYHAQNFEMRDGNQTVSDFGLGATLGPFDGLNSSYDARWNGPWLGGKAQAQRGKFYGNARLEYHWADYHAEANWNLRTDFEHPVSFEHEADGTGVVIGFGVGYAMTPDWSFDLNYQAQDFETDAGVDRTFFSNGTVGETVLNEATWESQSITLGTTHKF